MYNFSFYLDGRVFRQLLRHGANGDSRKTAYRDFRDAPLLDELIFCNKLPKRGTRADQNHIMDVHIYVKKMINDFNIVLHFLQVHCHNPHKYSSIFTQSFVFLNSKKILSSTGSMILEISEIFTLSFSPIIKNFLIKQNVIFLRKRKVLLDVSIGSG